MRFCMITTFYPPYNFGGDGVYVQALAHALADRGHSVDVIHCLDSYLSKSEDPGLEYKPHPNVSVHGIRSKVGSLSPFATQQTGKLLFKRRAVEAVLSQQFDVIHYHNISLVGGLEILKLGSAIKLFTLHDYWLVCPTHALFKFNRTPCERPVFCALCSLSYKRPPQFWRSARRIEQAIASVDALIAPSLTSKRKHQQFGINARIEHIPNFIALEPGVKDENSTNYFLFVGRIEKLKGLHTIIPIFAKMHDVELWIAGSGSDAASLKQRFEHAENIRFLGHQSGDDLVALYRNAVAVLYPSQNFQAKPGQSNTQGGRGAPLVVIEAFSQRTPVIANNIGQVPVILEKTGGGLSYDDANELIAIVTKLLDSPEYRKQLGANALQAYRDSWTADAYLKEYLDLINSLAVEKVD